MPDSGATEQRKAEHLRISLEEDVEFKGLPTGFECYRFVHQALPEIDLAEVDPSIALFGKRLRAPLLVSSMTGGAAETERINKNLAIAAQAMGIGMGLGSQRAAIEDPHLARTYQVRDVAPDILLLANLGAVQLNAAYGIDQCRRAVEMIQADGLILHLNPLQEAIQPGGNTNWSGLLAKIETLCRALPVPVVVKEVGWGISEKIARWLAEAGVAGIDVAGAGGTSWSEVEKHRADERGRRIAEAFATWGIPTAEAITMARRAAPDRVIIASGGIRSGLDVAKAIALGADAAGMAWPLLQLANESSEAVIAGLEETIAVLRIAMFCVGARDLAALRKAELVFDKVMRRG